MRERSILLAYTNGKLLPIQSLYEIPCHAENLSEACLDTQNERNQFSHSALLTLPF